MLQSGSGCFKNRGRKVKLLTQCLLEAWWCQVIEHHQKHGLQVVWSYSPINQFIDFVNNGVVHRHNCDDVKRQWGGRLSFYINKTRTLASAPTKLCSLYPWYIRQPNERGQAISISMQSTWYQEDCQSYNSRNYEKSWLHDVNFDPGSCLIIFEVSG